ncbi:HNH endonuclease [Sphingomonas sp. 3P27F8]|uniref:HNH endonuclease n=2 Tax=unclassified Sphingomonas TaxID=196159 RepID=UPI0010FA53EE|nr:HNH endonuclease [Sphingomonas sp. 3P27F8]
MKPNAALEISARCRDICRMQRCIYCTKTLIPRETGQAALNPSLEHAIPYSLGGSDGLATHDACVGCNNSLGDSVDAECINQPYIVILRQTHSIRGHGRTVPDLTLPATSTIGNEPATMVRPHNEPATFRHKPIVLRQHETYGEQVLVVGDHGQVTGIVEGIAAKSKRRGESVIDPTTGQPMDIAASIAAAEREQFGEYKVGFPMELDALRRGLIKIAFGFAHLALGWHWTGSKHARRMRAVVRGAGGGGAIEKFLTGVDPNIRSTLPMGTAGATDHLVCLMPQGADTQIIVSLFGDPLLSAAIKLAIDPATLEAGIAANDRMMATVDHQTRKTTWVGLVDFTDHIKRSSATV